MLFETGELQHHLGLLDLESATEELFTHRCRGVAPAEQRSEIAVPECRHFTDEEIDACLVVRHNFVVAEPPAPKEGVHKYLIGGYKKKDFRNDAIRTFFDWFQENYGLGEVEKMRQMRKMPRGVWAEFVRGNPVLKHHCTVKKVFSKDVVKYRSLLRRYNRALSYFSCRT